MNQQRVIKDVRGVYIGYQRKEETQSKTAEGNGSLPESLSTLLVKQNPWNLSS